MPRGHVLYVEDHDDTHILIRCAPTPTGMLATRYSPAMSESSDYPVVKGPATL